MQDRCAPLPRQFRKEHWLGILTFAETGKTFVLETMGITELNVKAIIDQIVQYKGKIYKWLVMLPEYTIVP